METDTLPDHRPAPTNQLRGGRERRWSPGRRGASLAVLTVLAALLLALLPPAAPVQAAVFNVNSLADPNPATGSCPATCTLRNAINAAAPGDTIQFTVSGTILLNATLILTKNVTIQGLGPATLILDGQQTHGVVQVQNGVQASLSSMTIQRGLGNFAGGVSNLGGVVLLQNVVVRDNRGQFAGGVYSAGTSAGTAMTVLNSTITSNQADATLVEILGVGNGGGIQAFGGVLTVSDSTVSNNAARASDGFGGGINVLSATAQINRTTIAGNTARSGGGVGSLTGDLTMTNSTISGNTATSRGGGLLALTLGSSTLRHVTLSGNGSPNGGGVHSDNGAVVTLRNSIVVNSPSGANCNATVTSTGNNLSDTAICFPGGSQGDIVSAAPLLGPLATNSPGATQTHALLPGSPAIDAVTHNPTDCPATIVTDQRAVARPQLWTGPRCDIGAFELESNTAPSISNPGGQTVNEDGPYPALFLTVSDNETPSSLTVTASSSNQALLPNTNLAVSEGGFLRGLTFSTLPNQSGSATVTLTVSDGLLTNQAVFGITVTPVNDAPTAANDSYTVNATQLLTAPAGSGLLANDADIDGPSLSATLVQGPANGALNLQPDGSFTYQPTGTFTGTDSFTYRATDGAAPSSVATVTIKVNPLPCAPRPRVQTTLATGGGKLLVAVASSPITEQQPAILRRLQFGELKNARVVVSGQTMANGQEFTVPGNVTAVEFAVERLTPGQPTTVPLTVVDDCGAWPTFVGGGTGAGF